MPSISDNKSGELRELVPDERSAANDPVAPVPSPPADAPSLESDAKETSRGSSTQVASGTQNRTNADTSTAQGVDTPSASQLDKDESEGEPGAFDDSHLQIDQPKKKKKKRSKRPKSKRGLVKTSLCPTTFAD